ncbi:MAG: helix-turn-helix domain-containing protein [Acidimicrobiales bacterium]
MVSQPVEETPSRFMTVGEVASVLRVSNMTVYRLIGAGELPAVRIGRSFRLRSEDFDRYLADRFTKAG